MIDKASRDSTVVFLAKDLANLYRSLSVELEAAADVLEHEITGADDKLPEISILRMTEAMRAAMILHYLADQAIEPAPFSGK